MVFILPDRPGNLEIKFCKLIEHSNIDAALMLDISLDPVKGIRKFVVYSPFAIHKKICQEEERTCTCTCIL